MKQNLGKARVGDLKGPVWLWEIRYFDFGLCGMLNYTLNRESKTDKQTNDYGQSSLDGVLL